MTRLADDRVLVVGGGERRASATAEIYNPALGSWTQTGSMNTARIHHSATLLDDGRVLVAGGDDGAPYGATYFASAEIYNPATGTWSSTGSLVAPRYAFTMTSLNDGRVLAVSSEGTSRGTAEIYNPASGAWSATSSLNQFRSLHAASLLNDGRVLIAGGSDCCANVLASAEIFKP